MDTPAVAHVEHFRQVLLWPLRLVQTPAIGGAQRHPWQVLKDMGAASPWREVVDEYTGAASQFHERHYSEFVTFLPYVQRFLYGEGRDAGRPGQPTTDSPMQVFRRHDIRQGRMTLRRGEAPIPPARGRIRAAAPSGAGAGRGGRRAR